MILSSIQQKVDKHLSQKLESGKIPGIQYVVVDSTGIKYEFSGGYMDVSSEHPVTSNTTFMSSSTTKIITAAAILKLANQKKIKLTESLSQYYPSHPYGFNIKIFHLLNQTSGIPNPMPLKWLHLVEDHGGFDEEKELKKILKQHFKLKFDTGTRYSYSNISYWLLGKIIEKVSGISYEEYMRQNILDPLGISKEELGFYISNIDNHACGHLRKFSTLGLLMPLMMDKKFLAKKSGNRIRFKPVYMNGAPYGGLIGTALGFSKFLQDQLQYDSILFNREMKRLFYADQTTSQGQTIETTLGWHRGELSDIKYYGKPGGGPGFQSNMRIYPSKDIATVWLANETAASEGPIHKLTDNLDMHFL